MNFACKEKIGKKVREKSVSACNKTKKPFKNNQKRLLDGNNV
jgi:hypothetical protein